jgi:SAM-dependent methyltransferase
LNTIVGQPIAGLIDILCCPRCRSELRNGPQLACTNPQCPYGGGFPAAGGQPILIDFDASIFTREEFLQRGGDSVLNRDNEGKGLKARIRGFLNGKNRAPVKFAALILQEVRKLSARPRLLVIGGGAKGSGTEALYAAADVELIGTDVYASPFTVAIADAHRLPFRDGSFDGVWIQAVLEHVLEPWTVAEEIHRVLKPGGLVFAETPFMQQVHERAYDFTRFTLSGHRWLFRKFTVIEAGTSIGAGTALTWSIEHFLWALIGSRKAAVLLSLPFFFLRFSDRVGSRRAHADSASGVHFFGRRSETSVTPREMVPFYENFSDAPSGVNRA